MSKIFVAEDGYYSLSAAGTTLFIVLTVILLALVAFIKTQSTNKDGEKAPLFSTKQLVFSAVSMALGYALSYVKLIKMPWGGSVTLCSMLFIVLIGYLYGPKIGLICGFTFSILQFVQDGGSYILTPLQVAFDYFVAFTALGASGFFYKKKNGLLIGYIVAILLRGLSQTIAGYLYWMDYMPEEFPAKLAFIYPVCYNYSFILLEGLITVIIISLPPVKNAINKVRDMAS